MPFEPLQTDEQLDHVPPRVKDLDSVMLAGCSTFVTTSILGYLLTVWPFFAVADTHLTVNLAVACASGMIPALILTLVATRKVGLPGACGGLGGAMASGIFLFLRLDQLMLGLTVRDLPRPDFPPAWAWIVPIAYVVLTLVLGIIFLPKDTFSDEPLPPNSQ